MKNYSAKVEDPNQTRRILSMFETYIGFRKEGPFSKKDFFSEPFNIKTFAQGYNRFRTAPEDGDLAAIKYKLIKIHPANEYYKLWSDPNFRTETDLELINESSVVDNKARHLWRNHAFFSSVAFGQVKVWETIVNDTIKIGAKHWLLLLKLAISSQEYAMVECLFEELKRRAARQKRPIPSSDSTISLLLQTAILFPKRDIFAYLVQQMIPYLSPEYPFDPRALAIEYFRHGYAINAFELTRILEEFCIERGLISPLVLVENGLEEYLELYLSEAISKARPILWKSLYLEAIQCANKDAILLFARKAAVIDEVTLQEGLDLALRLSDHALEMAWFLLPKLNKPSLASIIALYAVIEAYSAEQFVKDMFFDKLAESLSNTALAAYSLEECLAALKIAAKQDNQFVLQRIEAYAKSVFPSAENPVVPSGSRDLPPVPVADLIDFDSGETNQSNALGRNSIFNSQGDGPGTQILRPEKEQYNPFK